MVLRAEQDQRRMYDQLAWTWPIVTPPERYAEAAEQFYRLVEAHSRRKVYTLLDLGCGGGHTDLYLKTHYGVTGIDTSKAMLALAQALNPEAEYLAGDMRTVRLGRTFGAVLLGDAVTYMLTPADLRAAFETAYLHLRPGGVFLTSAQDTAERFQQNWARASTHVKGDLQITFVENDYDPDPGDTTYEYTAVYLIRRGGALEVEVDRHLCGLFPIETWRELLRAAGFQVTETSLADGEIPLFIAVRPD